MKKFGDRRDATKIKVNGVTKFLYFLKSRRSESEVYISREIDVTNLVKYMKKKKKDDPEMTYFHLFSMAIAKVIYNRPYLNRFVVGGNFYQRNDVTLSFVAKTSFTDDAKELLTVIKVDEDDNVNTLAKKIRGDVKKIRSSVESDTDDVVEKLGKCPKFVMGVAIWFVKLLDKHDLLPESLTRNSIYHSSVLLSNLGSIHCGAIYHNLTNFGTNSILGTIGEIKEKETIVNGKIEKRMVCEFGITLDERIGDGLYYAKSVNLLEYILANPELLEDKANELVEISKTK